MCWIDSVVSVEPGGNAEAFSHVVEPLLGVSAHTYVVPSMLNCVSGKRLSFAPPTSERGRPLCPEPVTASNAAFQSRTGSDQTLPEGSGLAVEISLCADATALGPSFFEPLA